MGAVLCHLAPDSLSASLVNFCSAHLTVPSAWARCQLSIFSTSSSLCLAFSHVGPGKIVPLGGASERCPGEAWRWKRQPGHCSPSLVTGWQEGRWCTSGCRKLPPPLTDPALDSVVLQGLLSPLLPKHFCLLCFINTLSTWVPEQTLCC